MSTHCNFSYDNKLTLQFIIYAILMTPNFLFFEIAFHALDDEHRYVCDSNEHHHKLNLNASIKTE